MQGRDELKSTRDIRGTPRDKGNFPCHMGSSPRDKGSLGCDTGLPFVAGEGMPVTFECSPASSLCGRIGATKTQ